MDMQYVHTTVLGLLQGVAEFLPISSSGHLVIGKALLRQLVPGSEEGVASLPDDDPTLEIALHAGTLLSILVVYRNDLLRVIRDRRLIGLVVLATIPVGVIGVLLKDVIGQLFSSPFAAGCALLCTASFLVVGRRLQQIQKEHQPNSFGRSLLIGLAQAVAIVPGISRSGSTIAAALACGLSREEAARFSFLIAIPAIGGATVLQAKDLLSGEAVSTLPIMPVVVGTIVAFVTGVASLQLLLKLLMKDRLLWFAGYCFLAGSATIIWQLMVR